MKKVLSFTKRNCLLFLRNKQVVFSSLISSIILIALYFLFIANLYSQGLNNFADLTLSSIQKSALIYIQMIMGVLVVNSVSLTTGMFSFMAKDFEVKKTEAFLLTNAKPVHLTISYLLSSILVSFALNFLTLVVSVILIGCITSFWLSAIAFFSIFGILILTCIIGSVIMLLITSIVRSSVAIGVINGILGTILGFVCGIYIPYSDMGNVIVYIGSLLPFTHLTIWLKQIALGDLLSQFGVSKNISDIMLDKSFSAGNVGLLGANVPLWGMILLSVLFAIICFVISLFLIKRLFKKGQNKKQRHSKDRKY